MPIAPYRGAGRPEANYALERAVEEAARVIGMDPVRLRKKNLIPPSAMPFKTPINTYDSGDFPGIVEQALELSDYANFSKRKREAARRKKLRGIGISCMLEHSGATPMEQASVAFPGGDKLVLGCNVQSTGQSHATVFGRLLADKLGIDASSIEHRHGDTALGLTGGASVGSRSAMCAGNAIVHTADVMLAKGQEGRLVAAGGIRARHPVSQRAIRSGRHRPQDFVVRDRAARQGAGREPRHQGQVRHAADVPERLPHRRSRDRSRHRRASISSPTRRWTIAATRSISRIVEGQVHGSLAQGLGQALVENAVYDSASGQLVSGSFMDYGMPHAHTMPVELREALRPSPAKSNPLGVKGTGEAGTTAAIAAVMNAISHAIPNGAADHMEMPATPAKVWAACQKAQQSK